MLLSCDQIKARNIVSDGVEDSFRFNSYDLTVGEIIQVSGDEVEDHLLKPQGIIEVISRERICLPENIVGYALVKTNLCNLGILPLNTGIIDSGYQGYLSTTLLNFGKEDFRIDKGDVFLRLTFQECHVARNFNHPSGIQSYDKYKCDKKKKMTRFSDNFLNLETSITKITDSIFSKYRVQVLTIAGIVLAIFPIMVTLALGSTQVGIAYFIDQLKPDSKLNEQEFIKQADYIEEQAQFELRVKDLEQQIKQLKSTQVINIPEEEKHNE